MPVYKDKQGKWFAQYNYKDPNGNYKSVKSKHYDTKTEATRQLAVLQTNNAQAHSSLTFNDVYKEYFNEQKKKVKPTTLSHYPALWDHIKDNLGDIVIERLTIPRYKAFKEYLDKRVIKTEIDEEGNETAVYMSTTRKNRCHKFIKALCKLAYDNHGVVCNIPERVGGFVDPIGLDPEEEEIAFITEEEFNRFIESVGEIEYRTLFRFLFYEGTRIGEALALTWHDIDFDKALLKISKTYTSKLNKEFQTGQLFVSRPKTKKSIRTIPIEKTTLEALKELHMHYENMYGFNDDMFVFGGLRPLSETTIAAKKDKALDDNGIKRITIHQFRHSCASYLFEKGAKITAVQKYLGHSKLSTTLDIYTHLYPEDLMDIHGQ